MATPANFYNIELEKAFIAGLLQYPDEYPTVAILRPQDFSITNSTIYGVVTNIIESGNVPSTFIAAERMKAAGIKLEGMEAIDYLGALNLVSINKKALLGIAKEIKKLSVARNIYERAETLKKRMVQLKDASATEIFKAVDEAFGESLVTLDATAGEAINVYEEMPRMIEELGANPQESLGYNSPFPSFNHKYAGFIPGQLYVIVSRQGMGKSTWLNYALDKTVDGCNTEEMVGLCLDTELDEKYWITRMAAARTGCPYFLIRSGQWIQSKEFAPKMIAEMENIRKNKKKNIYFKQVSRMGMDDLRNYVRNFFYRKVGRGRKCVIVYDYLKILGSDSSGNRAEYQLALDKTQLLKDLADETGAPILTALQANRSGGTANKTSDQVNDDESVVALSDRVGWLVNYLGILRRKTTDEVAFAPHAGTHVLKPLKTRDQGSAAPGFMDYVKIYQNGKALYREDYLNFNINNFNVEDKGTFRELAESMGLTKPPVRREQVDGGETL
jgi:replicative DNA helicase